MISMNVTLMAGSSMRMLRLDPFDTTIYTCEPLNLREQMDSIAGLEMPFFALIS